MEGANGVEERNIKCVREKITCGGEKSRNTRRKKHTSQGGK